MELLNVVRHSCFCLNCAIKILLNIANIKKLNFIKLKYTNLKI